MTTLTEALEKIEPEVYSIRPPHDKLPFGACANGKVLGGIAVVDRDTYEKVYAVARELANSLENKSVRAMDPTIAACIKILEAE